MALSKIDVANMLTGLVPNDNTIRRPNAKPLIINGDMQVAQRGTSFTHANSNNNEFPVDRFQFVLGSIGEYTSTQESLSSGAAYNAGFKKAARIDTTSAVSSPDAGDYFWFQYIMEAQDCLVFKKGTSSAEKMTVAFWVKSNKTGTGQLTVKDSDNDRQVAGTYAISSADTWEHKVINLPADTSGAMNNDNGAGFRFEWWLGAGSSYSGGAVPTAWEARADGDRGVSTLAINDNTANDWAITGIQVEVGEFSSPTLPPFQFYSFEDEDGFVYGSDVVSLYNLLFGEVTMSSRIRRITPVNPYNRRPITHNVINKVKKLIRLGRILKTPVCTEIENENDECETPSLETRTNNLFQDIDQMGHYTDSNWFLSLNLYQLRRFVRELTEIWNYRAGITREVKREICPPHGDPFSNIQYVQLFVGDDDGDGIVSRQTMVLESLEKIIKRGINEDSKALGAYYVLGALTLVNRNAALAMPWLYDSFKYN